MSFEKKGGHTKTGSVEAFQLGRHKCMICDAEFDIIKGKVHSCPDCKAEQASVICIEQNKNKKD
jgi:hypothetical protein